MSEYDFMQMQVPPPEGAICDFCSSPDVRWTYPCRDHARKPEHVGAVMEAPDGTMRVERTKIDAFSSGGWCACPTCHALIERGERRRLARRGAKRVIKRAGLDHAWSLSDATAHVRRLHDQFWANREGPPIHHDTRPKADPTR